MVKAIGYSDVKTMVAFSSQFSFFSPDISIISFSDKSKGFLFSSLNFRNNHPQTPSKLRSQFPLPPASISLIMPKCSSSTQSESPTELTLGRSEVDTTEFVLGLPEVGQDLLQQLVYEALVWCSLHGLVVGDSNGQRSGTVPGVSMVHAPISLLPAPFPETYWTEARNLAPILNELIDRVSSDSKFLQDSLSRTREVDGFTSKLLDIHSKVLETDRKEEVRLGLYRSDYMVDEQTGSLLQVEINTISASFCGLGSRVNELHRKLVSEHGATLGLDATRIQTSGAVTGFAETLARAWAEYEDEGAVVLFVVQKEERNMYDQHLLSSELMDKHGIKVLRITLGDIGSEAMVASDGTLSIYGHAVAVVYFRAGYTPSDYPTESEWRGREVVELSKAIKCPSISCHLAGCKKIQQELAKPGVVERFIVEEEDARRVRRCFAGLWSLDDLNVVREAVERPELFVMKPQREGGGNNVYGHAVRETLESLDEEKRGAYIIMQRIFPPLSPAYFLRNGGCCLRPSSSELGVYSAYLRRDHRVLINTHSGYLLRTKSSSSDEGGVNAGFAVLDSLYLT